MTIDISKFHQVFYEDSMDSLETVESSLLSLNVSAPDDEAINTIFRLIHSIKGGSGTFGFSKIEHFSHNMETLLGKLRDKELAPNKEMVDLLLKSVDMIKSMLESSKSGTEVNMADAEALAQALETALTGEISIPAPAAKPAGAKAAVNAEEQTKEGVELETIPAEVKAKIDLALENKKKQIIEEEEIFDSNQPMVDTTVGWLIQFEPVKNLLLTGNEPLRIFRELTDLGRIKITANTRGVPNLDHIVADNLYLTWEIKLYSNAQEKEVREVFEWVDDLATIVIKPLVEPRPEGYKLPDSAKIIATKQEATIELAEQPSKEPASSKVSKAAKPTQPTQEVEIDSKENNKENSKENSKEENKSEVKSKEATQEVVQEKVSAKEKLKTDKSTLEGTKEETSTPVIKVDPPVKRTSEHASEATSIRVNVEKIASLLNMVGELVITQSMLQETVKSFSMDRMPKLTKAIDALNKHTRNLQDVVMSVRMVPVSMVFGRFPRMVRDLSSSLGKELELKLEGENTELDKTVVEKISDPLVHLVRNALDHGLETPEERKAVGKPAQGTLKLKAYHSGGNIVIEISDDGRGINSEKVLAKAIEKGLVTKGTKLNKFEVNDLIFKPGFSTADQVSEISGRGVGMDVVRQNIKDLHGDVEIKSEQGQGTTFIVRLPLTLSILDGQLIKVGKETYIIPLLSISEIIKADMNKVKHAADNLDVIKVRDEYVPIVKMSDIFKTKDKTKNLEDGVLIVLAGDTHKAAILVDEVLEQQQIVIKSLDTNYKRVEGISGAATLGTGKVALILDVLGFVKLAGIGKHITTELEALIDKRDGKSE